ncbi:MAG TPA: DUF1559 domain-containing protein, partial [Phycisphaerae bacterium]|nr:DUF1559 domain-containing protein [Phycisphaerae bacterium]
SDGPTARRLSDIKDGSSNTIMIVEAASAGINWLDPRDLNTGPMSFVIYHGSVGRISDLPGMNDVNVPGMNDVTEISSCHPGGANVLFADGSVRYLSASMDSKTLEAMTTIDGGEAVGAPDF